VSTIDEDYALDWVADLQRELAALRAELAASRTDCSAALRERDDLAGRLVRAEGERDLALAGRHATAAVADAAGRLVSDKSLTMAWWMVLGELRDAVDTLAIARGDD
jgi:hypothetical protein